MSVSYPKRETHFAHKTFRLMHKASVAAEIGRDAFCIVAVVLHTEDAARYRGPVRFYNSQLMETLGFAKWESFAKARQRAIDSGWLVYAGDGKRSAGQYFVTVPTGYGDICDSPIEESPPESYPQNGYKQGYDEGYKAGYDAGYDRGINGGTIAGQPGIRSRDDVGELYNPIPNPNPSPESKNVFGLSEKLDQSLQNWIAYKTEKRQSYKPTGLKSLVSRVANVAKTYGDNAVIEAMERAMASGWQGWDHDIDKLPPKPASRIATAEDLANYPNGDYE
jgi:hypothetical protein